MVALSALLQVVDAAAGDVQSFCLLGNRQIVCAVIIVLRSAARLADAPSKSLFSSADFCVKRLHIYGGWCRSIADAETEDVG